MRWPAMWSPLFPSCPRKRASTSFMAPAKRKTWMAGTSPAMTNLRLVRPQLLQHPLRERAVDDVVEVHLAPDQALLGVEGEIVGEARVVDAAVRGHARRRGRRLDLAALEPP